MDCELFFVGISTLGEASAVSVLSRRILTVFQALPSPAFPSPVISWSASRQFHPMFDDFSRLFMMFHDLSDFAKPF